MTSTVSTEVVTLVTEANSVSNITKTTVENDKFIHSNIDTEEMTKSCDLKNMKDQIVQFSLDVTTDSATRSTCDTEMNIDVSENVTDLSSPIQRVEIELEESQNGDELVSLENEKINEYSPRFCYDWSITPKLLCAATEEYRPTTTCENFTKGCQWSPDGTCLLVPSEDFRIRIYELPRELYSGQISSDLSLPRLKPALTVKEGDLIYDSCWFPQMNSWDPSTCYFASTSRGSPIHLWDAFTGELKATYRAYNQVDEVEAAISIQFIDEAKEVWCGFKSALRIFDTNYPGRQRDTIFLKKDFPNVTGLISCIRENPIMPGLVAFGTYSKCIGLYKDGPLCTFKTGNGVTQIEFSPCGTRLYSAVRRSNELLCWDLRNPGIVLWSLQGRQSDTNQRIQFSTYGSEIVSGGTDGAINVWQPAKCTAYEENLNFEHRIKLSEDCINGISLHKNLPIMATSSGQRICSTEGKLRDNSVRLWWCFRT